ncbi:MAG: CRISPR locus-related DNA-binding protein [Methanothrix sp.]|jgi:CRISPR-associated protein Csa3|uniref:CRISPR-associated CARF protein Csa3 n=1 Tax=Methanothrix sp. TaxID=90426 RepID=UPI0025ED4EAE|nr:CRISPR-associated CARF protein Csa3 [Methanothrix sp.]MBK7385528.1 CRISPR locus-related DNA-binding protein [Methanothrix sp.]
MKTYLSLSGFDSSQIVSLIVKYGIEGGDKIVLIRPEVEPDTRGELTTRAIQDLSHQIDSSINLEIYRVNHQDFEGMVLSLKDLLEKAEGQVIANLSGGPREIFLAFTIACISKPDKIHKTTNFSDIDRCLNEIHLPNIVASLEEKQIKILKDISEFSPTNITNIAERLSLSESTISRQVARLADNKTLEVLPKGKTKELRITLAGKLLL